MSGPSPGAESACRALHWNGHTWTVKRSFPGQIGGAVVISRSDVWVFGEPVFPGAGLGAWHYNGRIVVAGGVRARS